MDARRLLLALAALVLSSSSAVRIAAATSAPEDTTNRVFARLPGTWEGEGTVSGMASRIAMTWGPAFDGRFVRVTWSNAMTAKDGRTFRFHGEGTYAPVAGDDGIHAGTWFDSEGAVHSLAGRVAGDSLVTEWGPQGAPVGRTTYRLLDANALTVHDEIRRDGAWRSFGRTSFRRAGAAPASAR